MGKKQGMQILHMFHILVIALLLGTQTLGFLSLTAQIGDLEGRLAIVEGSAYQRTAGPALASPTDFSQAAAEAMPAVVSVHTQRSQGSGAIFDAEGYVLTNRHVIDDGTPISVELADGKTYRADLVAVSQRADLAVLRIRADRTFPALGFADPDAVVVGMPVLAIGNPHGLEFTVSQGIVSARERTVRGERFLQTDVSINPGNSGGPLIGADGTIIGINTLKVRDTEGLSFSIPADIASAMAEETLRDVRGL